MTNPLFKFNPGDLLLEVSLIQGEDRSPLYVVIAVHPQRELTHDQIEQTLVHGRYHLYRLGDGYYFNVSVQWTHAYCVLAGK
jgi:hypothetical protein